MDYLSEILNKIIDFDVQKSIDKYFIDNKKFILELNKEQLYEDGVRSDGSLIGQYSDTTIEYKIRTGQRYDHITLNDKGFFYDSFKLELKDNDLIFDANPFKIKKRFGKIKVTNLFKEYGIDVMGLTNENIEYVLNGLKNAIIKDFENVIE